MGLLGRLFRIRGQSEAEGLSLARPRWEIAGLKEPARFFANLLQLTEAGAYVFLEGGSHPTELETWLTGHSVEVRPRPARGTIWPREVCFTVAVSPESAQELASLSEHLAPPEVCSHLHLFTPEEVLVSGYDAFADPFKVSGSIPELALGRFCSAAGCTFRSV